VVTVRLAQEIGGAGSLLIAVGVVIFLIVTLRKQPEQDQ